MKCTFFTSILFLISIIIVKGNYQPCGKYDLFLKSGPVCVPEGYDDFFSNPSEFSHLLYDGKYHVIIQFYTIPTQTELNIVSQTGIRLFDYISRNAYFASVPANISEQQLRNRNTFYYSN